MTDENVQGMAPKEEEGTDGFTVPPTGMSAQVLEGGAPLDEGKWEEEHPGLEPPETMSAEVITEVQRTRTDTPSLDATSPTPEDTDVPILQAAEPVLEEIKVPMGRVTICRNVEFRSRTGNYSVPAIINCTVDSIYQPGVEAGFVPPLSSAAHVHLTVFSPGRVGMRVDAGIQPGSENFVVKSTAVALIDGERIPMPVSENVSGCYQEWDVPYDPDASPGSWRWPTRV